MSDGIDTRGYHLDLYQDEDGNWVAEVPDLPGCIAAGATLDEAVAEVEDAIEAWLDAAVESGRAVPSPRGPQDFSGRFVLRVPRSLHRQLVWAAERDGVSLNTFCVAALSQAASTGLAWADAALSLPVLTTEVIARALGRDPVHPIQYPTRWGTDLAWSGVTAGQSFAEVRAPYMSSGQGSMTEYAPDAVPLSSIVLAGGTRR